MTTPEVEGQKVGGRVTGRRGTEVGTGDRETEDPDQVRRVELRARVTDRENNKQDRRSGAGDAERPWERGQVTQTSPKFQFTYGKPALCFLSLDSGITQLLT